MRTMRMLMSGMVAAGVAIAAQAGWEFTSVTKSDSQQKGDDTVNSTVKACVSGDKCRMEFSETKDPSMKAGNYMLTQDGGKTMYMVSPKDKTYMKWDMDQMMGMAGTVTKMMNVNVVDPKVEKLLEERGEKIAGLSTTHYKYRNTYTMETSIFGMKNSNATVQEQDIWASRDIEDLGMGAWLKRQELKTGDEALDKLIKQHMTQVKGFPLKTLTVNKSKDAKGRETTSKTSMEVTEIKKTSPADSLFKLPADYKEVSMFGGAAGGEGEAASEGKTPPQSGPGSFFKMLQNTQRKPAAKP